MRRISRASVLALVLGTALGPIPGRAESPAPQVAEEAGFRTDPLAAHVQRAATTRRVSRLSVLAPGPAPVGGASTDRAPAGAGGPVVGSTDFDALSSSLNSPADPTGAVGREAIVAAVNTRVAVYDRGGALIDGPTRLDRIAAPLRGLNQTDPKVVYDPYDDVFVLTFLTYDDRAGFIDVVTIPGPTADDRSTWCVLHMSGDQVAGNAKQFADYPSLGFTKDRVTVTTNNFDFRTLLRFEYVQVVSFTKQALYEDPECDDTLRPTVFSRGATRDPDGSRAFTIQPATSIGPAGRTQWMTSLDFEGRSSSLVLWRLGREGGGLRLRATSLRVGSTLIPPSGRQCGGTPGDEDHAWDTGDTRLINAWFDARRNRVYSAHAVRHNAGGGSPESAVRWYEVRPSQRLGHSEVTRRGQIVVPDADLAWPSIATDGAGTVFLNYSRASASECLGIWGATVAGGTGADAVEIVAGETRYEFSSPGQFPPGTERWGDYSAIARDPRRPGRMAFFNAYAAGGGATTSTFVQRVTFVSSG